MIVTDKNKLTTPCDNVSIEEGEKIGVQLFKELKNSKTGIGLAANQIGINKRVCVINVKDPIVLINPKIVERSEETFIFAEGCLSFPKKKIRTERHVSVVVEADNYDSKLSFTADSKDINDAFECCCIQHEIDHLDGIVMFERKFIPEPIVYDKKIPRNKKVTIEKDGATMELKYKKAESYVEDGWTLVGQ